MYNVKIWYFLGKDMQAAYTFSRGDLLGSKNAEDTEFEMMNVVRHIPASQPLTREIEKATRQDDML